jgi:hypothetical protein
MHFDIGMLADMKILNTCVASILTVTELCVKTDRPTLCHNPEDVHVVDCLACLKTYTALLL